jgi:hypothetical protein
MAADEFGAIAMELMRAGPRTGERGEIRHHATGRYDQ